MDPVTHAIVGATVSYALCGNKLGRHAAGLGALAAITPDVDHFISSENDPLLYVEYHRFFTHSLAFSLLGVFGAMLPWLFNREFRSRWKTLWLCAWPAYLSHCLLDACTTWGTQLYWPLARTRVSWDIIAIVDPLFTFVLAGLLAVMLFRRSRAVAGFAAAFAAFYLSIGFAQHTRARSVQRQLAKERGHVIEHSEVMPTLANNVVWRSVYRANGRIYADRIRAGWFSPAAVREGTSLPAMTHTELRESELEADRRHGGFERFAWFTSGCPARSPQDETIIGDMRYSRSTEAFDPVWGIRLSTPEGRPTLEWISRERERRLNLLELWAEIAGNDPRFRTVPSAS